MVEEDESEQESDRDSYFEQPAPKPQEVIVTTKPATERRVSFEEQIKIDEERVIPGLGDFGDPVKVVPYTSDDEIEKCMKKEAFNRILSDKISLTRKVPDARHPL